ncbi:MAG: pyridoxamine 5'-phosphate oxidase family protein [Chloroflexi bacterium]|nr:pyridoxamine 5'-phosphate oxidase family protein [Chloroflexota bacterium]
MIDEEVRDCLAAAPFVAFATVGSSDQHQGEVHLAATRGAYVQVLDDHTVCWPAGWLPTTTRNLGENGQVLALLMADRPEGPQVMRLHGTGAVERSGPVYEQVKARYPWAQAAIVVQVKRVSRSNEAQYL